MRERSQHGLGAFGWGVACIDADGFRSFTFCWCGRFACVVGATHTLPNGTSIGFPGYFEVGRDGELGDGSTNNSDVPVPVVGITNAVSVVGGDCYTHCAVLTTGAVDCWGSNVCGELGNALMFPAVVGYSDVPVAVGKVVSNVSGTVFSKITNAISVAAGAGNYCAAPATGAMDCWGVDYDGELGNGSTSNSNSPIGVTNIANAVSVVAAQYDSYCATFATGAVYCWGLNQDGELGDGNTTNSDVPVPVLGIGSVVPPPPNTGPVIYDALGDSFSSGEGTGPPYLRAGEDGSVAASDTPFDQCHRSKWAYSVVLHTKLLPGSWVPTFAACSDATTNDLVKLGQDGERARVKWFGKSPDLVTLTIGGNNVKFAPTLEYCIGLTFLANTYNRLTEPPWPLPRPPWLLKMNPSCADSPSFRTSVEHSITNARSDIEASYALVRHTAGPNASVVAIGYPELFPTQFSGQNCVRLSPWLTLTDQTFSNQMAGRLDNVESLAAIEAGVNFVNARSAFAGHGVCGSKGEWINGITWTNTDIAISIYIPFFAPGLPPRLISISVPLPNLSGSFHPDGLGQLGYAKAIVDYMSQQASAGAPLNTHGVPLNPAPGVVAGTVAHASTNSPVHLLTAAAGSG
ncbi:MAG: hypothetical protein ACYDEY_10700 [Acidimicrobiales bacterium]